MQLNERTYCTVTLESLMVDLREVQNDFSIFENEMVIRPEDKTKKSLKNFHKDASKKVEKLKDDYDRAQVSHFLKTSYVLL